MALFFLRDLSSPLEQASSKTNAARRWIVGSCFLDGTYLSCSCGGRSQIKVGVEAKTKACHSCKVLLTPIDSSSSAYEYVRVVKLSVKVWNLVIAPS